MNASERLNAARAATAEGRHAEALEGLEWFHAHALAESRSYYGVRLSFALSAWTALAALYPAALASLYATRERAAAALLAGTGDRDTFNDVVAIDARLDQVPLTYQLYVALEERQAEIARACGRLPLDALLHMGDFARAARIAPDPDPHLRQASARLHADLLSIKSEPISRAPKRWACISIYIAEVKRALAIVNGLGQHARAALLANLAVTLVASPSARREVAAGLVRPLPAPAGPEQKIMRLRFLRARRRETAERRRARMRRGD